MTRALDEVNRHAGLFFKDVRLSGAVETIEAWIAEHRIANPIDIGPGVALDALLEDLVVHESYFDRDLEQLRLVDELVLAELARTTEAIRVWSAGCASGEEPYTLAFMLAARGLLERAIITATDLSRPALARAAAGRYRAWAVRTGANSPAMRYLVRSDNEWRVPESIKASVEFAMLNLVEDPFPTDQRLIVCRNVLIYLDTSAVAVVARKFAAALAPDGWLCVAPSDPRLDPHAALEATVTDRGVYYRPAESSTPVALPARRTHPATSPLVISQPLRIARAPSVAIPPAPKLDTQQARDRARMLADRGDHVEARAVLAAAILATPLDGELYFLEAVLSAADDIEASLASLDRAIYLSPEAPVSYLFAGRLLQAKGDIRGARSSYARALAILEALAPDERVMWSDEPAWIMADACRRTLAGLS
ncbi:MAG TPA: CheR family methyltransferase [Kofleriaceae bacterium]|nr:CheR family methyltransferase [Kofleriaceae bacterium]